MFSLLALNFVYVEPDIRIPPQKLYIYSHLDMSRIPKFYQNTTPPPKKRAEQIRHLYVSFIQKVAPCASRTHPRTIPTVDGEMTSLLLRNR